MEKPICKNFTELAAHLRNIDPAAATGLPCGKGKL